MSSTDQEIEELKASTRRLEEKINDLIQRHPALRRAEAEANIHRLRAKHEELTHHLAALVQVHKSKSEFLFLPAGVHSIIPMEGGRVQVIVTEQAATQLEGRRMYIVAKGNIPYFDFNHENGQTAF